MPAPLILARSFKEAHAYAQGELGLTIGFYRVVNSVGTIKAVRNTDLHLVPGWDKRPGHHAFKSALRYCKLTIVDPSKAPAEPVAEPEAETESLSAGTILPGVIVASGKVEANAISAEKIGVGTISGDQIAEPAEKSKAKRRTRCKECEQLHFKGDPCIESEDA